MIAGFGRTGKYWVRSTAASSLKEPPFESGLPAHFSGMLKAGGLLTMTYTHRVRIQPAMTIDEGIRRPRFWAEVFDLTMRAVEVVGRLANVWSQEQTVQVAV